RTEPITGDAVNNKIVQNTNKTKIMPALGALMHFYEERPQGVNWGGAFGLSINNDTHVNYHGGLSVLFGDTQRIILSGGATLSQVKLISDDYQVGGTIPVSTSAVPTSNYYRWGWFLGLTYNLSN
ncbi:MAG: hypothetical protein JWR02_329, partial [Mucilaginibacter sp.]|nr:hypothetical protein [Mucilaginibacter sp.]